MKKITIIFAASFSLMTSALYAAEVKNLKLGQNLGKGYATYDLIGKVGEKEAEVTVTLTIGGERYTADKLTLSGDIGKKVKIGVGKRITWDTLADLPAGFEGDVTWDVEALSHHVAEPAPPVAAKKESPVLPIDTTFTEQKIGMQFVKLTGGCYQMGDTFGDGDTDEKPVHEVCLSDFMLGKYDVTVGDFRKFTTASGYITEAEQKSGCAVWKNSKWVFDATKTWKDPGFEQDDLHPVVCVSWNDATAFAKWLSAESGKHYRLPTEAEWEYAARSGGKLSKYAGFNSVGEMSVYANFCDSNCELSWKSAKYNDSYRYTSPVGNFKSNELGLYDMSGNVLQWLSDWYGAKYYKETQRENPQGPASGDKRLLRGGSWLLGPQDLRAAFRSRYSATSRNTTIGFRLALSPN